VPCSELAPKGSTPPHEQPQDGLGPRERRTSAAVRSNAGFRRAFVPAVRRGPLRAVAPPVQAVAVHVQQAAVGSRLIGVRPRPHQRRRAARRDHAQRPDRAGGGGGAVGPRGEGSAGPSPAAATGLRTAPNAPPPGPIGAPAHPPAASSSNKGASERPKGASLLTGGAAVPRRLRSEIFGGLVGGQRPPTPGRRRARSSGRSFDRWRRIRRRGPPSRPTSGPA